MASTLPHLNQYRRSLRESYNVDRSRSGLHHGHRGTEASDDLLLRVEMVGLCGTDLNSYRGKNPMVTYPRVIGHEIAATVLQGSAAVPAGTRVVVSPYPSCGVCPACRRGRNNACQFNQTFGVQRDGAHDGYFAVSARSEGLPFACLSSERALPGRAVNRRHACGVARASDRSVMSVADLTDVAASAWALSQDQPVGAHNHRNRSGRHQIGERPKASGAAFT